VIEVLEPKNYEGDYKHSLNNIEKMMNYSTQV